MDVYKRLFLKMSRKNFPDEYKGFKMVYDFKEFQADVKLYPTEYKILKMWELLNG